jgi:hypothetical protein
LVLRSPVRGEVNKKIAELEDTTAKLFVENWGILGKNENEDKKV